MKYIFTFFLFFSFSVQVFGQTNIAVPSYSSVTHTFDFTTGNIKFYLNGVAQTLTVGHGANGVCFFENNMFVAYDDGNGTGQGLLWYKNVTFASGTFVSDPVTILVNNKQTFQVVADASGNIYSANFDGTITKFTRNGSAPYYSNANQTSVPFFSTGNYVLGGLFIDNSSNTLWATSYINHTMAVCKLNNFDASGVKPITISNNYLQAPEGIVKDNFGNIWVANNNNNYIVRINNAHVTTIINELNANNYSTKNLDGGTEAVSFEVSAAGHQLGGLVYDNLYSSKIYVNDQANGGNTALYSFTPTNGTPTFSVTGFSQVFPGNGQAGIIPCAILPPMAYPSSNSVTINSGQTATLVASGCAADQTYRWKQNADVMANTASFTTPILTQNTTYQAYCVRAGTCESAGTSVEVVVNPACSTPANPTAASASPSTINSGQTSTLTASGCVSGNTYLWKNGTTTASTNASFVTSVLSANTTYTAYCVNGSCQSSGTNVMVTVNSMGGVTQTASIAVTSALQTNNPRTRTFSFRLPNVNQDCNRPLLIALHGDGGSGTDMTSRFDALADTENFIAVYPNSLSVAGGVQWNKFADGVAGSGDNGNDANAADDEKFIADIIDYFYLNYGIDRSKVYVTGHSGGGFMTYFLALSNQTKNKIAAIAPVAASLWGQNAYLNAQVASGTFVPTPLLHIHSTTDGTVSFPTLSGWTWPLASFSYPTCSSSAYTTAVISAVIDKHTFCNSPTPVVLMGLKQAGLGHAWPTLANSTYNASQEIWDFVKNHSKGSYAAPTPTISPTSVSITSGNSTTLTASGCGALGVFWSSGQTTTTITVSPTATTNYTVSCRTTASNCQLGNVSAAATVTVGGVGSLSTTANPATICAGQTSSLSAVGCTGGTISWSNGQTGVGALVFPATTTTYTATCSTGGSSAVTVSVYPNNVVISTSAYPNYTANQVVQASQTITTSSPPNISITTANSNKLTYQAGKSITLSPGFSTQSGAVFSAKIGGCINTTTQTMQVNGRFLYDANGQKIVLIGANLPILDDWDFPTSDKFLEYEKTGANVVRISWYMDYGQPERPAYSLTDLDNFLTKCQTNKIIPVIDIHDYTCGSDMSVLNSQIIPWWTSAPVLAIINKHKKYLIINLANELGIYRWAGGGNEATALLNFKNAYKTAITTIRNAGIDVPIMIDAPDCGTTIGAFNLIGAELVAHDPKHNLLLSAHAYWADYDGRPEISPAIANNLPIVFGEVGNKQDESILLVDGNGQPILDKDGKQQYVPSYCHYDIDGTMENHAAATGFTYQNLMNTCQTNEIGTMIYAWNKDNCSSRQMSSTGNYINLTTFGNDVVNSAIYGIKNKAVRSNAF